MKDVQSMLGVWDHLLDAITANSYDCLMAIKKRITGKLKPVVSLQRS